MTIEKRASFYRVESEGCKRYRDIEGFPEEAAGELGLEKWVRF